MPSLSHPVIISGVVGGILPGPQCGRYPNGGGIIYTSSGGAMQIKFTSDSSIQKPGFAASYKSSESVTLFVAAAIAKAKMY